MEKHFFEPSHADFSKDLNLDHSLLDDLFFDSSEGRIHAWLLKAKGVRKGLVLHFHGNAMNITTHVTHVDWLINHGFDVLTWDYAGYGKSGGTPSFKGIYNQSIEVLQKADQMRATNGGTLVVLGQSLGGTFAVSSMPNARVSVDALVLDCVFASPKAIAAHKFFQNNRIFRTPFEWLLGTMLPAEVSIARWISAIDCPVVFMHGIHDSVVPMDLGLRAYHQLADRESNEFLRFEAGHCEVLRSNLDGAREKLVSWLELVPLTADESDQSL
ncbi:MAG: alpha/beta fold hydrolase [Pseudobacteriovorax sp.]|nr:alpha/beta fold hydrolase [Pseudobacteriovorax sp.]